VGVRRRRYAAVDLFTLDRLSSLVFSMTLLPWDERLI
jgi:hypothetical protein